MVYKECNVGSAKPSDATLEKYPHHLVNHVSLDSIFSVADFYVAAMELINKIHSREKIPLMVGGSMMYFNLLKTGISKLPPANRQLREKLEEKILTNGVEALHADLKKLDADAADNIKPQDSQRIIRAIEIITSTGISLDGNLASLPKSQLKILKKLIPTHYHKRVDGEVVVKKTEWFLIKFNGDENTPLIPDRNEGITECKWFTFDELVLVLEESHERIRYLIEFFLNMPYYKKYRLRLNKK